MLPSIGKRRSLVGNSGTFAGAQQQQQQQGQPPQTRLRSNSVELDLSDLSQIRSDIQQNVLATNGIVAQEHQLRQAIAMEEGARSRGFATALRKSFLYASYQDVQRDRRKHQENATRRLHELFEQCRSQERVEHQSMEEQKHLARLNKTKKIKASIEATLQQHWNAEEHHRQSLHQHVQEAREAQRRQRLLAESDVFSAKKQQMLDLKTEKLERSRQRVSDRALERTEKRRVIQQTRAMSCSPTAFMALPPMKTLIRRGTFAATVDRCREDGGSYRDHRGGDASNAISSPHAHLLATSVLSSHAGSDGEELNLWGPTLQRSDSYLLRGGRDAPVVDGGAAAARDLRLHHPRVASVGMATDD